MNECTPALFRLAPNAASMAAAELGAIQACIRSLGLAPTKAKNLKAMSQVGGVGCGGSMSVCLSLIASVQSSSVLPHASIAHPAYLGVPCPADAC